jgi:hypothetical protein
MIAPCHPGPDKRLEMPLLEHSLSFIAAAFLPELTKRLCTLPPRA